MYTCVGTKTCKGDRPGSFDHWTADATTLAGWGIDFVYELVYELDRSMGLFVLLGSSCTPTHTHYTHYTPHTPHTHTHHAHAGVRFSGFLVRVVESVHPI